MHWFLLLFTNVYALLTAIFFLLWYYLTHSFGYWKQQGINFPEPLPFFGNFLGFILRQETYFETLHNLYRYFEDEPFGGVYQMLEPILLVKDPQLVHCILVKDFSNFVDRSISLFNVDKQLNPLNENLFFSLGDRWRALRRKLSPIFTSGKLKMMKGQMDECLEKLQVLIENDLTNGSQDMNVKAIFDRLTIDVIGSCAFGIECNALEKNSEFRDMGNKAMQPPPLRLYVRILLTAFYKPLLSILKVADFPNDVSQFFMSLSLGNVKYRRNHNYHRPDLLQLLMELQNANNDPKYATNDTRSNVLGNERFDEIHLAANSFVFFIAGFETTSTTLSFCFYEMALNPDVQNKVLEEVKSVHVKTDGKLTHEHLNDMPYLDAVLMETLRKYPIVPFLSRVALEDYTIPDSNVVLKKGTNIIIPVWSLQNDWKYFKDPLLFNPDRFLGDNRNNIINGTYTPFGDGPRFCIGSRFAKMEMKLAAAELILKYEFSPASKTAIPMKFAKGGFIVNPDPDDGLWLKITKRN